MNILLINDNPMVSGLVKLCVNDDDITLDEVNGIDKIKEIAYDAIFVDEGVYFDQMWQDHDYRDIETKVFFSHETEAQEYFDITLRKPFSPLQIIQILQSIGSKEKTMQEAAIEENSLVEKKNLKQDVGLSEAMEKREAKVLDMNELKKIQELLEMTDEMEVKEEPLSEDEIERRKLEAITEQLMADGVEIVSEETIVEELESIPKRKKSKKVTYDEVERERIEDAMYVAIASLKPKKLKKLLKGKEVIFKIKLEEK